MPKLYADHLFQDVQLREQASTSSKDSSVVSGEVNEWRFVRERSRMVSQRDGLSRACSDLF